MWRRPPDLHRATDRRFRHRIVARAQFHGIHINAYAHGIHVRATAARQPARSGQDLSRRQPLRRASVGRDESPAAQMALITVNAAASSLTVSGTFAQRFFGTHTTSACFPFDATRSPTENPSDHPHPSPSPRPHCNSPSATADRVCCAPPRASASSRRCSPCPRPFEPCLAVGVPYPGDWPSPNSTNMRPVPAETNAEMERINTCPGWGRGQGTSTTSVAPVFRLWRICFTRPSSANRHE